MAKIELEQGSEKWLAWRASGIGGSDASKVVGENPWCTPYQLYLEKTGRAQSFKMTPAMQRGVDLEPLARTAYEEHTGIVVVPACFEDGIHLASVDGINLAGNLILESKSGETAYQQAFEGIVPRYYFLQIQHCLMVTGAETCHYWAWLDDGRPGILIEVQKDNDCIAALREAEIEFWDCVRNDVPPDSEPSDYLINDDPEAIIRSEDYLSALDRYNKAKMQMEIAKEGLLDCTDDGNCIIGKVKCTRVVRKGAIDYKRLHAKFGINEDATQAFRKPDTSFWKLTETK